MSTYWVLLQKTCTTGVPGTLLCSDVLFWYSMYTRIYCTQRHLAYPGSSVPTRYVLQVMHILLILYACVSYVRTDWLFFPCTQIPNLLVTNCLQRLERRLGHVLCDVRLEREREREKEREREREREREAGERFVLILDFPGGGVLSSP